MRSGLEIRIEVESQYAEDQSSPEQGQYAFAYRVTIHNMGAVTAQLVSRHWIITDADGEVQEVRGPGVVGEQPVLRPGESFRYVSGAVLPTPVGSMHGSYQMVDEAGQGFDVAIPAFRLAVPTVFH